MYIIVHEHRGTSPNAVLKQKSIFETASNRIQQLLEAKPWIKAWGWFVLLWMGGLLFVLFLSYGVRTLFSLI